MDKKRILEILEGAKDDNGEIPMSLVRKAFEKIEEPCEDAVSRQAVINIINKPVIINAKEQIEALPSVQPKLQPTCNNLATDTISRQAAIDAAMNDSLIINAMDSVKDGDIHRTKRAIVRLLASLPPAEPEIIRCKDCKYGGYEPATPNKYHPCDLAFPAHWRCYYYKKFTPIVTQDGFCNKAERRSDEND